MTTKQEEARYEQEHLQRWARKEWAVYNPHYKPQSELPNIFGFNNSTAFSSRGFLSAVLVAEDGTGLGSHACSSEAYMPSDLGVLTGSRPDRHEDFKKHYPDGYKMSFTSHIDVLQHKGITKAFELNQERQDKKDNENKITN